MTATKTRRVKRALSTPPATEYCDLQPGDRVVMTTTATRQGFAGRLNRFRGVVKGPSRSNPGCVSVQRDGEDRTTAWAPYFWMRESDGKIGRA